VPPPGCVLDPRLRRAPLGRSLLSRATCSCGNNPQTKPVAVADALEAESLN
jgi:hypothetical protein